MLIALSEELRLKFPALEARKAKLLELDATIVSFYRREPRRFYASTLLYLVGWMLDTVEIYLVAQLLDMPITLSQAVVMEAFTGVAKVLGMWLPGSLGVQESGTGGTFGAGNPAGTQEINLERFAADIGGRNEVVQ